MRPEDPVVVAHRTEARSWAPADAAELNTASRPVALDAAKQALTEALDAVAKAQSALQSLPSGYNAEKRQPIRVLSIERYLELSGLLLQAEHALLQLESLRQPTAPQGDGAV